MSAALKALEDAAAADEAAAQKVTDLINALPEGNKVTEKDKTAVEAARAAYDALTDAQKKLVSEATLKRLTDAEFWALAEREAKHG